MGLSSPTKCHPLLHQHQHRPRQHPRLARVITCAMRASATKSLATARWTRLHAKAHAVLQGHLLGQPARATTCVTQASATRSLVMARWTKLHVRVLVQSLPRMAWWCELRQALLERV